MNHFFEVQASNSSTIQFGYGEQYNNVLAPDPAMIPFGISTNRGYPTTILVNMYEPGDKRKNASIFVVGDKFYPDGLSTPLKKSDGTDWTYTTTMANASRTGYNCKKYISGAQLINTQENGPANPRVLRYAEVLLIKAEAVNEIKGATDAFQYINMVRTRAGLPNLDDGSVTDQTAMRAAIWKERALELFLEGDRWFDLKRTGRLITQLIALNTAINQPFPNNDARHWMMPIPQNEIERAVLKGTRLIIQNPIYQ
ncbi:MAG: RagB/SusD family nutrient uptake outer membrane protein [Bacteroidales bacterium]|nr:RagB/SusD family nutrient uptake outer membrane protein [Bacteroidales bacterium]